jgi:hypothetical protein
MALDEERLRVHPNIQDHINETMCSWTGDFAVIVERLGRREKLQRLGNGKTSMSLLQCLQCSTS